MSRDFEIKPDHYWDEGSVPVFKPTYDEFKDFPKFMKAIDSYGMQTGIVKVIPPTKWLMELPDYSIEKLSKVKCRNPIEQIIQGNAGNYRHILIQKQKSYDLADWKLLCDEPQHQAPAKRGEVRKSRKEGKIGKRALKKTKWNDFMFRAKDIGAEYSKERLEELEKIYWKTVTYNSPIYGADMPGSLFDESTTIWNVSKLDNVLQYLKKIPGVNNSYLYLGMWKASFSWHVEDMDLYSINYIHFGAPKQWYSISQKDSQKFESLVRKIFSDDYVKCDQFLRHKNFSFSPWFIEQNGVPVNRLVHYENEFVITFPYGYHAGYNLGFNCAESVNFATPSWIEIGKRAKHCKCVNDTVSITSKDIDRLTAIIQKKEKKLKARQSIQIKSGRKKKTKLCRLCPNDTSLEPIFNLEGDKGQVHGTCAIHVPETYFKLDPSCNTIKISGFDSIDPDRFKLRCIQCQASEGVCIQCSSPLCKRSYHPTCAAMAGVFCTYHETQEGRMIDYYCRFHRPIDLNNVKLRELYCRSLKQGDFVQIQDNHGSTAAGPVVDNFTSENMVHVKILDYPVYEVSYANVLPFVFRYPFPTKSEAAPNIRDKHYSKPKFRERKPQTLISNVEIGEPVAHKNFAEFKSCQE